MLTEAEERETARSRALSIGIATSVLSRGLAAATPLLVVPMGLGYLGADGYGAWATAISVTSFVAFADLGVGTGLMTRLGQSVQGAQADFADGRRYVSSAYVMMAAIASLGLILLLGTAPLVNWPGLLGMSGTSQVGVEPIVLATLSAFVVNMFASLVVRVQYGVGQQGRSNLWQAASSLSTLGATWLAAELHPGPGWFVAFAAFAPVLISALNSVVFFGFTVTGRLLAPTLAGFRLDVLGRLMSLGSRFLVVSVLMAASIALDPWIVARTAGLTEVATYAIPYRVFAFLGAFGVVLTLPLWPMHSAAVVSGEVAWIRRITIKMTLVNAGLGVIAALLAVLLGPHLLRIWIGEAVTPAPLLWGGLGLWWFAQSVTGPAFMVQNGAEVIGPQLIGYSLLLIAFPLKWWVSSEIDYALIPYVGAVLYIAFIWPACLFGYRRALAAAGSVGRAERVER